MHSDWHGAVPESSIVTTACDKEMSSALLKNASSILTKTDYMQTMVTGEWERWRIRNC